MTDTTYVFPDFERVSNIVADTIARKMSDADTVLLRADIPGDTLVDLYLDSFLEGTNPVYRERRHYDGNYDKSFIRHYGNLITIDPDTFKVTTIWSDYEKQAYPFNIVLKALHDAVVAKLPFTRFATEHLEVGHSDNYVERDVIGEDGTVTAQTVVHWYHFRATLGRNAHSITPGKTIGEYNGKVDSYRRSLETYPLDVLDQVVEMAKETGLVYRLNEYLGVLTAFRDAAAKYNAANDPHTKTLMTWVNPIPLRSIVVGSTLLDNIIAGDDIEVAVKKFESAMGEDNFNRSKALITPGMINKAMETIESLGLHRSLERRAAVLGDVTINSVLWVDRDQKAHLKGATDSLKDMLMASATRKPTPNAHAIPVTAEAFLTTILPHAVHMEAIVGGNNLNNFATLTGPEHTDAPGLFKWDNAFAWSYRGDVADSSIKQRVEKAGGKVRGGALRVSLGWYDLDDLDLHCIADTYVGRHYIYFGDPRGILDVDMNARTTVMDPVENMFWGDVPPPGVYNFKVHNYRSRPSTVASVDKHFDIELEMNGETRVFTAKSPENQTYIDAFTVEVTQDGTIRLKTMGQVTPKTVTPETVWGVTTLTGTPITAVIESPNYWGENKTGNRHVFFILEGCKTDAPVRGIYNEFLRSDLTQHRKVFEVLGDKTRSIPAEDSVHQLSGLGFSESRAAHVLVSVENPAGKKTLYKVQFGHESRV